MVGKKAEAGGIAKDGAKMVMAVANVKVGPLSSFQPSQPGDHVHALSASTVECTEQ
jgi:hypothetical protein